MSDRKKMQKRKDARPYSLYEAEVLPGLKDIATEELQTLCKGDLLLYEAPGDDQIIFAFRGAPRTFASLRTVVAVYLLEHFDVSGPRALLGTEHAARLVAKIKAVAAKEIADKSFTSFRIAAAGKDSSVMQRLASEISARTGLEYDEEAGELLIRIRPSTAGKGGWEVLLRLSARPLSAREWRVVDMPGALNATIAAAMVRMLQPKPNEAMLNLMCGSGTLLIELLANVPSAVAMGLDDEKGALHAAKRNIAVAKADAKAMLLRADAANLPFGGSPFPLISADLPWGERVGRRSENVLLYGAVLREAARIAARNARMILLTQDQKSLEAAEKNCSDWKIVERRKIFQGGYHPVITLYQRGQGGN